MLKPYQQRFPWNLDWNLLRTFMVVVDEGGITPAAHFLGLKQPTISAALKRLEDITGHILVNRSPKHFSVTPRGQVLYSEASAIFGAVAQLPDLMGGLEEEVTGQINIAVASHVVSPHFDAVLERFNARCPGARYTISTMDSTDVIAHLQQNRVTFGVCLFSQPPADLEAGFSTASSLGSSADRRTGSMAAMISMSLNSGMKIQSRSRQLSRTARCPALRICTGSWACGPNQGGCRPTCPKSVG